MPNKEPIVKYSNGQHQFKVPFIMYADFGSILEPIQGWCLHTKFAYGKVNDPTTQYRGTDCVEKFCEKIISEAKRLYSSFPEVPMLKLTKSQTKATIKQRNVRYVSKNSGIKAK